jgi:hypothetical protein
MPGMLGRRLVRRALIQRLAGGGSGQRGARGGPRAARIKRQLAAHQIASRIEKSAERLATKIRARALIRG